MGKVIHFKEGSIVKIEISGSRLVFGRLLPGYRIGIYDLITSEIDSLSSIESVIRAPIFLYCVIYKDVITKGVFQIIGFKELSAIDLEKIPPSFTQDLVNIDECVIFYYDGKEKKANPEDCINLERASIWEAKGLIQRIEDFYAGRRNPYLELDKVILSKNDPRYLNPNVRWDFKEERFFRQ
jgi:hypothetical protein